MYFKFKNKTMKNILKTKLIIIFIFFISLVITSCATQQRCIGVCKAPKPKLSTEDKRILREKRNKKLGKAYCYTVVGILSICAGQIFSYESNR